MRILFLACFALGLAVGVISMIVGIDRDRRHGRWIKYLNLPTAGAVAAVFGVVGYPLAKYSHLGSWTMIGIAAAAAAAAAVGTVALIAGWAVPAAEREVEDERYRLQGHPGRVSRAIQPGQPGEITYDFEGQHHTVRASGLDDSPIAVGAEVVIDRVENGVAYVELWSTIAQQLKLPT